MRKHWTMKEMMKKYKDTLISSALITLIGAMVGITSIKDKWINVFFVVAYFMHVIIIFYDKKNRQQSRKVIEMTIWLIPIMTLLYNGMAKLTHMGAETEDLFMALIMEQAYCLLL